MAKGKSPARNGRPLASTQSAPGKGESGSDGPLLSMLAYGVLLIVAVVGAADRIYGASSGANFVASPVMGMFPGDIFVLSLSYPLLMLAVISLRSQLQFLLGLKTAYNVAMTLFSLYCFCVMAVWKFGPREGAWLPFSGAATKGAGACDAAFEPHPVLGAQVQAAARLFFLSKFVEWIDSVFLLLANKPISVLHGFHHLGAPIAMGTMVYTNSEFVWIFVLWNSCVHTIMYAYYGCSGVGIKLRFIRPWITRMQIIQFLTGMPYLWWVYGKATLPGGVCSTDGRVWSFLFQFVYVTAVLSLFVNFFIQQYSGAEYAKKKK